MSDVSTSYSVNIMILSCDNHCNERKSSQLQNLKSILFLTMILAIVGCRNRIDNGAKSSVIPVDNEVNKISKFESHDKFKLKELSEIADDEEFSKEDFNAIKFVWLGERNPNNLMALQYKRVRNKVLDPFENDNTVSLMSGYRHEISPIVYVDKEVLLPMHFHSHEMYTIWYMQNDTFSFRKFLKPSQAGRYESSLIDSIFELNGSLVILGMTIGGEGGETWNSFWVKKVTNDSIIELERTPIDCNAHLETQEYVQEYKNPYIKRTIFRDSIYQFKDTVVSIINVNDLLEKG